MREPISYMPIHLSWAFIKALTRLVTCGKKIKQALSHADSKTIFNVLYSTISVAQTTLSHSLEQLTSYTIN
jgi:hypothetical protein